MEQRCDERLTEVFEKHRLDYLDRVNNLIAKERAAILKVKRQNLAQENDTIWGFFERQCAKLTAAFFLLDLWENYESVEAKWELPPLYTADNLDENHDELVEEYIWEDHSDFVLEPDDEESHEDSSDFENQHSAEELSGDEQDIVRVL
eukprot:scaffold3632_cov162-Amphora_coffeaeformis.AAC.1